ncbi:MAG: UPF0149 family protein [Thiogranum sp.]|nr:UPF0149 family protein [Thiogranum sp.]
MSQNQSLEYDDLMRVLEPVAPATDASDCHGLLCGLICAAGFGDPKLWVQEYFEDFDPRDAAQSRAFKTLQELYEQSLVQLNSADLDFELLLPEDDEPLAGRTESLGLWCSGFLSGLAIGGLPENVSDELRELLDDLTHIARVEFEPGDSSEEESVAFEEVVEYVRIAVLYAYEELQPPNTTPTLQ